MNIIILQLNIVGYADKFSLRPNEEIKFMVSCKSKSYTSTIVKLIHGDDNSKGPGFKEKIIRQINGPAGMDIGGQTAAEIALSMIAEVIASKYGKH